MSKKNKYMCECGNYMYLSDDKESIVNNVKFKETWTCEECGDYFYNIEE